MTAVVVDATKMYRTSGTARAYPLSYFGVNFDVPYTEPYQGRTDVPYFPPAFYPETAPADTIIATLTIARSGADPLVIDDAVPESMQNSFFLNLPTDMGFVSAMNMARSAEGLYVMRQTESGDARMPGRDEFLVNMKTYPETSSEDVGFLTFLGAAEDKIVAHGILPPDYPVVKPRAP